MGSVDRQIDYHDLLSIDCDGYHQSDYHLDGLIIKIKLVEVSHHDREGKVLMARIPIFEFLSTCEGPTTVFARALALFKRAKSAKGGEL